MVKKMLKAGKTLFACEECGMAYTDKAIAEKCKAWCGKHHSCNLEIIKYAVE